MVTKRIKYERREFTSFLCLIAVMMILIAPANARKTSIKNNTKSDKEIVVNTFNKPDFAFPKTVEMNARESLDKALQKGDCITALQAAIQIDIAGSLIDSERINSSISLIDSLANLFDSPYNSVALLLETRLYSEVYSSQSRLFDGRVMPASPLPDNIMEWNRNMFIDKVCGLVEKVESHIAELDSIPLSDISSLLVDEKDAVNNGFSIGDFVIINFTDILLRFQNSQNEVIPFANTADNSDFHSDPEKLWLYLIDKHISFLDRSDDLFKQAWFAELKLDNLNNNLLDNWIDNCYSKFGKTVYGAPFVTAYARNLKKIESETENQFTRRQYDILSGYIKQFPNEPQTAYVYDRINSLLEKKIEITVADLILPATPTKIKIAGSNIYNFYILVLKAKKINNDKYVKNSELSTNYSLISAVPVNVKGEQPDSYQKEFELPGLEPGQYCFVTSATPQISGKFEKNTYISIPTSLVSDIRFITVTRGKNKDSRNVYLVSSLNQKPMPGISVKYTPYKHGKPLETIIKTTDINGMIELPATRCDISAKINGNYVFESLWEENYAPEKEHLNVDVQTDLPIYKPGDRIGFNFIAYKQNNKLFYPLRESDMTAFLVDANYEKVDSLVLISDDFGRANGSFIVPQTGLLGDWNIQIEKDKKLIVTETVTVAEYKSPTFYITVDSSDDSYQIGDNVKFIGKAMTYSGMPVAGGEVKYTVRYRPDWWRANNNATFGGTTTTDENGSFSINLPTDNLKDTTFETGLFSLTVTITDKAGESQSSPAVSFSLGNAFRISGKIPEKVNADEISEFYIPVYDMTSHPVEKTVYYQIKKGDKLINSGSFISPDLKIDLSFLPSGEYTFRFSLDPDFKDTKDNSIMETSTIIWRKIDKVPPVNTPVWVNESKIITLPGEKKITVPVGSSYEDSWILVQISNDREPIRSEWHKVSLGFIKLIVNAPEDNQSVFIQLMGTHDLDTRMCQVTVMPMALTTKIKIGVDSFRENIEPGSQQSWKFSFILDGVPCRYIPVVAVMSNKALNALSPFNWNFDPFGSLSWSPSTEISSKRSRNYTNSVNFDFVSRYGRYDQFIRPEWNTYGYNLFNSRRFGNGIMIRGTRKSMTSNAIRSNADYEEVILENSADLYMAAPESATTGALAAKKEMGASNEIEGESDETDISAIRNVECPLAFFMPDLVTDDKGKLTVEFKAPDFVGTWQLQLLGYTPEMKGSVLRIDAISAKLVMARLNSPRFVRSGDLATVSATLFNNTVDSIPIAGKIEIVNHLSGEIICSEQFNPEILRGNGSRIITAAFKVGSEMQTLAIRAYAISETGSDGEQSIIPVLPSSQPVTESTPFYIENGKTEFKLKLPEFEKDSKVTLSYCDNPVWECVTALPAMLKPESVNNLSRAYALFGNAVSANLFNCYPELIEGIASMSADSVLLSPLEKNQELKTVLLNNTPWVNSALSETVRMQSLLEFADKEKSASAVNDIMKLLSESQQSDGGWSWCPEMKSSAFITGEILHVLASLSDMGCLPDKGSDMALKAFKYMDKAYVKDWNESKRRYIPVRSLLYYLFDKTLITGAGSTSEFKPLEKIAFDKIQKDWRELDVSDKATAAMLFERKSLPRLARLVLESLRQFASVSPEKGMWFANADGYNYGDITATAKVLDAYSMIEPGNPAIDQLRQWLVISKQTQNWGTSRQTANAIHSILTTGTDWTKERQSPTILLNGKPIDIQIDSNITGSFTADLDSSEASGATLIIDRHGSAPAWGGVMSKYIAPVRDVKASETPELSIKKEIYVISTGNAGMSATDTTPVRGDKVRVTLTITCDRNLEYVAVTDPRAACLEPVNQISGFTSTDGLWYYKETRNTSTNLFIQSLPKGTHVISYDCYADRSGSYASGIAEAQSEYAPVITAHTAGTIIQVSEN